MKLLIIIALVACAAALPLDQEWQLFKKEHGKEYSVTDEVTRYNNWKYSLEFIEDHNKDADKHGYTLGMNEFGDMTDAEFVAIYNGYKMAPRNSTSKDIFYGSLSFVVQETVDWSKEGYVTDVKNQGQCGSCWAFSTTGSLEGQHFAKTKQLVSLSEQNLMDCSTREGNHGCKGGLMDNAFEYIIKNGGIDTEESYPYMAHDETKCRFKQSDVGATMTSYKDIQRGDVQALTQAVQTIGPISVAMDAGRPSFRLYKKGVYSDMSCSSTKLDHGVLAVGFGSEEGTDYFLVKNSWGPRWGMEGYFMIERSEKNMCGLATQASYPVV